MIRTLLFDFDGTLTNRQENVYHLFAYCLRKYFPDFDEVEFEAVLQDMMYYDCNGTFDIGSRMIPFMKKYKKYLPEDFLENFVPEYYDHMYEFTPLKEETMDVLEALKGHYQLAIMSNGGSKPQHAKIDFVGISPYFDLVWVSGDHEHAKPEKAAFDEVLGILKARPEETLMIGDVFSNDILGAHNAGIRSVWIIEDTERPCDHYKGYRIRKLDELFGILDELNNEDVAQ